MGLPYEATFQFEVPAPENEGSRLDGVVQFMMDELSTGNVNAGSEIEVESGDYGGYAYAMVKTERPHPQLAKQLMQLEVRLCAADEGMGQANFRSRFVSGDGVDPPEVRAGPPRLLLSAMERFDGSAGGLAVGQVVRMIDAGSVADFVREDVLSADRTLPMLVCSERQNGKMPLDPDLIQRELLGLARVVRLADAATRRFGELASTPCYNGAARWLWPGVGSQRGNVPSNAYVPPAALTTRDALYNLQQTALGRASRSEFDGQYSICRTEVILERNRQLEAEKRPVPAAELDSELRAEVVKERRRANEYKRRLGIEQGKVANLDQELAGALSRITDLEADSGAGNSDDGYGSARERRDDIRDLRDTVAKRDRTIADLNGELQRYRQEARQRRNADDLTLPIRYGHPGLLTICDHALNLYRDPMRRFVIGRLRASFGADLEQCVMKSVDFSRRPPYNAQDPDSAIDIGDFEDLVQSNDECFADDELEARLLGYIRTFRNRVSHPPRGGLDESRVLDGLNNITKALTTIGEQDAAGEVSDLINLVR